MFKRILVCLDGSKFAETILPCIVEQVKSNGGKIFLLSVNSAFSQILAYLAIPGSPSGGASAGIAIKLKEMEIKSYLDKIANYLKDTGLDVECISIIGNVADIILKCVKDNSIDLVAMATHAYKGWKRLVFGSTTEQIMRECNIPILVINPSIKSEGDGSCNTKCEASPVQG